MTSSSNETDSRSLVAVRLTNPTPTPPKGRVGTAARRTSAKPRSSACRFGATKSRGHDLTDAMARPYTRDWRKRTPGRGDGITRESAAWHSDRQPTPSSISACMSLPRDLGFRLNATARDHAQRARNSGRAAPGNGVIARCPDPPSQPRTAEFRALYRDSAAKRVAAAFAELAHEI